MTHGRVPGFAPVHARAAGKAPKLGTAGSANGMPCRLPLVEPLLSNVSTLINCNCWLDTAPDGRCLTREVFADAVHLDNLKLLEPHDAPHRGLIARLPDESWSVGAFCRDLVLSTLHHTTPTRR